jgi:hypothetical protein
MDMGEWSVEETVERTSALERDNLAHAAEVADRFSADLQEKYTRGFREHGGRIWLKPGMMKQARGEILDLAVYLDVTERQLREIAALLDSCVATFQHQHLDDAMRAFFDARKRLDALLNGETD